MNLKTPFGYSSDDFISGSKAAIYGGNTTIIDFVTPRKGQELKSALDDRRTESEKCYTDYSFHVSPVDWRDNSNREIEEIINSGINSFKVYMAYKDTIGLDDEDIFNVMKIVGKRGGIVTLHCENGDEIENLRDLFIKNGKFEPKYHAFSRPDHTESESVQIAIELAKKANCPIYIVHVSSEKSLIYIKESQSRGQKVYAETCPQYLLFEDSKYEGSFNITSPYVFSPPLRKKKDNFALWNGLKNNIIQTLGTDHCPFMLEQKRIGLNDFRKISNGAGGVEHRFSLLYTYGVLKNKINLNQFVEITSTNAAKIFGFYPQKGAIKKGSDADIIIWNPHKKSEISVNTHQQNSDINIYNNLYIAGEAETVILRGNIILQNREMKNITPQGKFLRR